MGPPCVGVEKKLSRIVAKLLSLIDVPNTSQENFIISLLLFLTRHILDFEGSSEHIEVRRSFFIRLAEAVAVGVLLGVGVGVFIDGMEVQVLTGIGVFVGWQESSVASLKKQKKTCRTNMIAILAFKLHPFNSDQIQLLSDTVGMQVEEIG